MNGQTERHATMPGEVRASPFPTEWGPAPRPGDDAATAAWALRHIKAAEQRRRDGTDDPAWLARTDPREARALLTRRAVPPCVAARHRLALLEHRRAAP